MGGGPAPVASGRALRRRDPRPAGESGVAPGDGPPDQP